MKQRENNIYDKLCWWIKKRKSMKFKREKIMKKERKHCTVSRSFWCKPRAPTKHSASFPLPSLPSPSLTHNYHNTIHLLPFVLLPRYIYIFNRDNTRFYETWKYRKIKKFKYALRASAKNGKIMMKKRSIKKCVCF